jgi:hypothetical protein
VQNDNERNLVTVRVVRYRNSTSLSTTNEMFAEKPHNARVELAVKGGPVEAGRIIGANARYGSRELWRAGCQECKVAGWHDMNVRFAREAICNASIARTVTHAWASPFGSPELEGDFNSGQIILRKNSSRWIDNHRGLDTCIMRRAGRSFPAVKLLTSSHLILTKLCEPHEIRRDSHQHQAGIAALGKTEETDPGGIDNRFVFPVVQHEIEQTNHIHRTRRPDG